MRRLQIKMKYFGSCFMADTAAEQSLIEGVLDSIRKQLEVRLNDVQSRRHKKDPSWSELLNDWIRRP
jgi:hypothetical protein